MPLPHFGALVLSLLSVVSAAPHPSSPARPPATVLIRVLDSVTRRGLPNAEVSAAPRRRLTDAAGNARFTWPDSGTLHIRVREIGYHYADRTIHRGTSSSATEDTVIVVLPRAVFALPQMITKADVRCDASQDSASLALSTSSMELLRFGAEQYNSFRATYPFDVTLVRRTVRSADSKGPRVEEKSEVAESATYGDQYAPGQALQRTTTGYFIPWLFVASLADTAFLARHCFVARGVESRDNRRVIRLDFAPAHGIREVDWAGSAWLDSAASVLRRIDFHLVNVRDPRAPKRFEGYTTFSIPSPFIAVPDSTVAWWWSQTDPKPTDDKFTADVLQFLTTRELAYRRGTPPAPVEH